MISLDMPTDVRAFVLDYQGKKKAATGLGHYSQQQAIVSIIREMMELDKKKKEEAARENTDYH